MVNLTHFDWSGDLPVKPAQEDAILEVLAKKEKLKYLSLIGEWGRHARGTCQDSNSDVYPVRFLFLYLRVITYISTALENQEPYNSYPSRKYLD
jgi:hypothetical protein